MKKLVDVAGLKAIFGTKCASSDMIKARGIVPAATVNGIFLYDAEDAKQKNSAYKKKTVETKENGQRGDEMQILYGHIGKLSQRIAKLEKDLYGE